jgi:hypothetical protein
VLFFLLNGIAADIYAPDGTAGSSGSRKSLQVSALRKVLAAFADAMARNGRNGAQWDEG